MSIVVFTLLLAVAYISVAMYTRVVCNVVRPSSSSKLRNGIHNLPEIAKLHTLGKVISNFCNFGRGFIIS
jgi:hypothetical protein